MKNIVLITLEPMKGSVLCRIPGCGNKATVQLNRYFGVETWDARSSGPVCEQHLAKFQEEWSDCEIRHAQTVS